MTRLTFLKGLGSTAVVAALGKFVSKSTIHVGVDYAKGESKSFPYTAIYGNEVIHSLTEKEIPSHAHTTVSDIDAIQSSCPSLKTIPETTRGGWYTSRFTMACRPSYP